MIVARMDSNRAHGPFFEAHPDWFARRRDGEATAAGALYVACIHSPYYDTYLPEVLQEVIERYHPDGFADNNWSGLGRDGICYCSTAGRAFMMRWAWRYLIRSVVRPGISCLGSLVIFAALLRSGTLTTQ